MVGGPACPRCRLPGTPIEPPSWRWVGQWLLRGRGARPRMRCDNGHTWAAGTVSTLARRSSVWNLPIRLLRALQRNRTAEPSPLFMLGVAVLGVALGVALDAALGWPWWLVALLTLAIVWLGFLATALAKSERSSLAADLLSEISRRRAREHDERRLRRLLAAAPVPPYGVAGWDGPRSVGSRSWGSDGIHSVGLVHGSLPDGPYVEVVTTYRHSRRPLPRRRELGRSAPGASPRWSPITLSVGGVARPFRYLPDGAGWVARAQLDDVVIEMKATGVPVAEVALESVANLEAYA